MIYTVFYPQLFAHIFGEEDGFSGDYYFLVHHGILRKGREIFERETEGQRKAVEKLGETTTKQFRTVILK